MVFASRILFSPIFCALSKNESITASYLSLFLTIGAYSFRGASLLIFTLGKEIWIVVLNLCLNAFCGALHFLDVGIHALSIFFCICLPFVLTIFPMNFKVLLPMKSWTGSMLLNLVLTSSFVIHSSFIFPHFIPKIHLMAEWWNTLIFLRLASVKFHVSEPQRSRFSGPVM